MYNLTDIKDKFNNLSNSNIYVLNNSFVNRNNKKSFNISGIIEDHNPNYNNKAIDLLIKVNSGEEETVTELDCTISATQGNNYTVICPTNKIQDYNFQSASSFIDNDILLINFDKLNETSLPNQEVSYYRKYNLGFLNFIK